MGVRLGLLRVMLAFLCTLCVLCGVALFLIDYEVILEFMDLGFWNFELLVFR